MWTEQVIFGNIYTYMYVIIMNIKEVINLNESGKEYRKGLEGGKEREKCN